MKLAEWLKSNAISRVDFARRIGVSPGTITQLCNQDDAWLSRETAELISNETKGAVTPNDFLSVSGTSLERSAMHHSVCAFDLGGGPTVASLPDGRRQ